MPEASDYRVTNDGRVHAWETILKVPADIRAYGAAVDGITDDTSAIQDALDTGVPIVLIPDGTTNFTAISFNSSGQQIVGLGKMSILNCTGAGTAISASAKSRCDVKNLKLVTSSAVNGISFAAASNHCGVKDCWVEGFSGKGIIFSNSLYGTVTEHCEIVSNGTGIQLTNGANSTKVFGNEIRQNLIGIQIDDTDASSNGSQVFCNGIESSTGGSTYAVKILGGDSNAVICNRLEYTVGSAHIFVDYGTGIAQFNQFLGNMVEGTIPFFILGDGTGTGQVWGTYISGGRAAGAMTINSDATYTRVECASGAYDGALTDNGYGSAIKIDSSLPGKWYDRNFASNTNNGLELSIGGTVTIFDMNDNQLRFDFTSLSSAFTFKDVNAGGTHLAVMMFGSWRIWVDPGTAKMYVAGADPTTPTDGSLIGPIGG